jgi:lipopolysaccharide biosynthesis regulator YciM
LRSWLVEGRWIDRRRVRRSPFFILGLNHLVTGQVDLAIQALEKASSLDPGAFELRLVLGNLHREKGQVGRAIGEHQALLQRPRLNKVEQANVLLCLGLDYRRGGFVDRAVATFTEVLKLDPDNEAALLNLEKLQEDQHLWQEAYDTRRRLAHLTGPPEHPNSQSILAFLENELGMQAMKQQDLTDATRRFEEAIEADPTVVPAYLHLGDVREQQGDLAGAAEIWERAIDVAPDRAYLALDRIERVYTALGTPVRFADLCRKLFTATPRDWRARMALARHLAAAGQPTRALDLLFEALEHNPHALAIHQAVWNTLSVLGLPGPLVARYIDITRESVFYLDPHVCIRCRYRSTELLWQCPHCHEWNTFVEERITPASDTEAEIPAGLAQE